MTNWARLLLLILKRDRLSLPVWILAVTAFCVVFVPAIPQVAGTPEEIAVLQEMMKNPALIGMCGIAYGETYTIGIMYTQMMMVFSSILVAVMNILLVIRHTRADEDEGRLEVIRALPTGRLSNLAAVTVLMVGVNLVVGLLTGFGMASFSIETVDLAGSLVYAAALAGCGLVFAGLTMIVVQLVWSARAATGLALGLMGFFYILRAYGDISSETASRISPLGLVERTLPYYENHWWPVFVLVGTGVVLMGVGFALNRARDLGAGLLPPLHRQRAHAPALLSGEWGLAWRLTRATIIAWGVTVFVLAAMYGTVMGQMESFLDSSPLYQQMMGIGADTVDVVGPVVSMLMLIMALIGAIPVLVVAYKLASEERRGRLDYVLGKSVSRDRLFAGYALLVVAVAVVMQALSVLGFWPVAASVMDDPMDISLVAKVAFNYLAPMIALGGLGFLLVGWAKKLTWIGWAYLVASFLVVYMGGMLNVPRWAERLVPFGMVNRWPTEAFSWWPWISLVVAGVLLAVLGAVGFRRRDVTA